MQRTMIIQTLKLGSLLAACWLTGCAQPLTTTGQPVAMAANVPAQSAQWCQDNYISAAVSHQQRSNNAKYCDPQARQRFLEHKDKAK